MPNWNLSDDWPVDCRPLDEDDRPVSLFMMPISQDDVGDRDEYHIHIARYHIERDGSEVPNSEGSIVKLIIDIHSSRDIEVHAMTPGSITMCGNTALLVSHCFSMGHVYGLFGDFIPEEDRGRGIAELISWFHNWDSANRRPHWITYENIQSPEYSAVVNVGDVIGTAAPPSREYAEMHAPEWVDEFIDDFRQVRLKFEYNDSIDSHPKCMHPREFFSLLFWRERCDPVYKDRDRDNLEEYDHPLLQKMMRVYDDGDLVENSGGSAVSSIRDVLDNLVPNDDEDYLDKWIGLRPPLRTYKRVEWEARLAHIFYHNNWQKRKRLTKPTGMSAAAWVAEQEARRRWNRAQDAGTRLGRYGDLTVPGGIRNPLINNSGYSCDPKCNILAGELAFRAGFRVFCQKSGSCLSYLNTTRITEARRCTSIGCISPAGGTIECPEFSGSYRFRGYFGQKIDVPVDDAAGVNSVRDTINQEIDNSGGLYIHSRRGYTEASDPAGSVAGHVVILAHLDTVRLKNITGRILDQHCDRSHIPLECRYRRPCGGSAGPDGRAFIRLYPGGDPTEHWGILDLNCLVVTT